MVENISCSLIIISLSQVNAEKGSRKMVKKKLFAPTLQCVAYFLVYTCSTVFSEFTVKPQNTLAELGKETSLECCSSQRNSVLEWHFRKWNNDDLFIKLCSHRTCHREGYSVGSHSHGCSRLNINSSKVEVAGLYKCNERGNEVPCGAYLVTYQFNCGHNISSKDKLDDGLRVLFTCTALWNGKLPFEMVFTAVESGKKMKQTLFSQRQDFYSSSLPVDLLEPIIPPYMFSIQLLSTGNADECIDTHSPIANWSSPGEQLMYAVTNVRTNCPKKDCEKKKGDVINCSADGFPSPMFQWLDWDLKPVGDGSVLQVSDVGSFEFTCISRNMINQLEYGAREKIVVTVTENTEGLSLSTIVGIFVAAISIQIIIRVLDPANIRKFVQIVNGCFKKLKNIRGYSESGIVAPTDDIQMQCAAGQAENDCCGENNPTEVDPNADETGSPLITGPPVAADFGISVRAVVKVV